MSVQMSRQNSTEKKNSSLIKKWAQGHVTGSQQSMYNELNKNHVNDVNNIGETTRNGRWKQSEALRWSKEDFSGMAWHQSRCDTITWCQHYLPWPMMCCFAVSLHANSKTTRLFPHCWKFNNAWKLVQPWFFYIVQLMWLKSNNFWIIVIIQYCICEVFFI